VTAFGAAEEPDLALIRSPELAQPPEGEIILTFRAFYLDGGHGFYLVILIVHNRDLVLRAHSLCLHLVSGFNLSDISALATLELSSGRDHHGFTFRTKHRYSMRDVRRLTLLSGRYTNSREILQFSKKIVKTRACLFVSAGTGRGIRMHGRILFLVLRE
jgi:hypothetical protein